MAAPINYYVDPAINGNSGTGTLLDPFGDLQWALDHITRDATNGDQVNIKAGTAEVLAASLALTTYGTPAAGAPLILRGYTSAAGDGGIAEINCNGVTFWAATNYPYWVLAELQIHNFGSNNGIASSNGRILVYKCKIHKGASNPSGKYLLGLTGDFTYNAVIGCHIYNAGTNGTGLYTPGTCYGNYIYNCPTGVKMGVGSTVNNIFVDCVTYGVDVTNTGGLIANNTFYSSSAAIGTAINGGTPYHILNNVIEGYSGTGGKGVAGASDIFTLGYNSTYNNATAKSVGDVYIDLTANDVALAASPFTNSAGGDFSLNKAVTGCIENAYPGAWYGPASTNNKMDRGAVQNGAGSSGGVSKSRIIGGI